MIPGGWRSALLLPLVLSAGNAEAKMDGEVAAKALDRDTRCAIGRGRRCGNELAIQQGLFETGLRPIFPADLSCRDIDEQWAISYTAKRGREAYHGGIDMPAPWGTPIIAAAAGRVVGKYRGKNSYRGIEIVLRHSPEQTGLPFWIYTQYTHFSQMPKLEVGQRVALGEVLGPTGNSGRGRTPNVQNPRRRPAIHFAVFYSRSSKYVARKNKIIPLDGRWMDPNALFRKTPPFDSRAMKALPATEKKVPIAVMLDDGEIIPAGSRIVWPYLCSRR